MNTTELIGVFRACGGTVHLNPDGVSARIEGNEKIWPLGKELIQRAEETLYALRAGEPASADELIAAWKALPKFEQAAFGEYSLAEFDEFALREAKRLILSATDSPDGRA